MEYVEIGSRPDRKESRTIKYNTIPPALICKSGDGDDLLLRSAHLLNLFLCNALLFQRSLRSQSFFFPPAFATKKPPQRGGDLTGLAEREGLAALIPKGGV